MPEPVAALQYQNQDYVRRHERQQVNLAARVLFPEGTTMRGLRTTEGLVLDISRSGLALEASLSAMIPEWFYVEFPDLDERLTCFMVGRSAGRVHAQFQGDISQARVDRIANHASARPDLEAMLEQLIA